MSVTAYRNITVNLTEPRSQRDKCAEVIVNVLGTAGGAKVPVGDLDVAISKAGVDLAFKTEAIKALRNMGYPIIARKARHLSWYKMDGTPDEYEDHRKAVVREAYSRQVSICRELAGVLAARPQDVALQACFNHAQLTAIGLGTDVAIGMTIPDVMTDLAILAG